MKSLAATTLLAALAVARPASAQQPAPAQAPAPRAAGLTVSTSSDTRSCPDAATLARRVNEITGWHSIDPTSTDAPLTFSVQLDASQAGHTALIRATGTRTGERRIADIGTECAGLAEALAVTLAIIIDDERIAPADGVPTPRLMPEPDSSTPPSQIPPEPPPPPPTNVWRPYVALASTIGVLETVAFGPALGLAFARERLVVGLEGWWLPARTFQLDPGQAEVSLLALSLHGCWKATPLAAREWVALCAHVSGGRLSGTGAGFSRNDSAHRPWIAPGVGALGGFPISAPVELFGGAKLAIPVHRESFVVSNLGEAHETPPIGLEITTGVSVAIE